MYFGETYSPEKYAGEVKSKLSPLTPKQQLDSLNSAVNAFLKVTQSILTDGPINYDANAVALIAEGDARIKAITSFIVGQSTYNTTEKTYPTLVHTIEANLGLIQQRISIFNSWKMVDKAVNPSLRVVASAQGTYGMNAVQKYMATSSASSKVMTVVTIAGVAAAGYFLYKRYIG